MNNRDEIVDGFEAASRILKAYPSEKRERLLASIARKDPELHRRLSSNIFTIADIPSLTDQSIQKLASALHNQDLVTLIGTAQEIVQRSLLRNMSARRAAVILDDIQSSAPVPQNEQEVSLQRIVELIDELRKQGLIRSKGE